MIATTFNSQLPLLSCPKHRVDSKESACTRIPVRTSLHPQPTPTETLRLYCCLGERCIIKGWTVIMNSSALTLEFELQANAIAASAYPHTRYSLISEIDSKCVSIEFKGFFTVEFDPKNRPHQNPTDEYYRNPNADFSLMYFPNGGHLILSG